MSARAIFKSFLQLLLVLISLILLSFIAIIGTIWLFSGNTEPLIKGENGDVPSNSVTMIIDTVINDASQRLTIRGYDINNPILLKVHGGPASYFIHPWVRSEELEKRFIVCYWDQRGNGPAYNSEIPDETLTLEQIIEDGIEVTRSLKDRFNKEKIFLLGHSWGTAVGSYMSQKAPELYYAYIGIGQMADQPESEKMSFTFVLKEARTRNDSTALADLASIGPPPYDNTEEMVRAVKVERQYVNKYNAFRDKGSRNGFPSMMKDLLLYKGLTFSDKINFLKGVKYNEDAFEILWPYCARVDLTRDIKALNVPVFIIQGKEDHHTETLLAKDYFDSLQAPLKKWYLFEKSTHWPELEEPERFISVIDSIIELTL